MGRHTESLKLREETLAHMKAKLSSDDPRTLGAMLNLAVSYATVGERDKALKLNEEVLTIRKAKLGADDPATLMTMNNLAGVYRNLARYDDALRLAKETVDRANARLGAETASLLHARIRWLKFITSANSSTRPSRFMSQRSRS